METKPERFSIAKLITLLVLLLAIGWLFMARQSVMDWVKLRDYTPSAEVTEITKTIGLTPYGEKLFYVNHPEIDTKRVTFAKQCPIDVEKTVVLGCYLTGDNGIFLFDPADPRLDGVTETTAAHETLHAAYERLSDKERQRINALLLDFYETKLTDERIKKTIESYRAADAPLENEMHSIFGTEVAELPAELESYYAQYFTNRKLVIAQLVRYQEEFNRREAQVAAYDAQLAAKKPQIEQLEATIKSNLNRLTSMQRQLSTYETSGSTSAYNALVPTYNSLVDAYNAQLDKLQAMTAEYNRIVEARNSLAVEEANLVKALSGDAQSEVDSL